MGVTAPVTAALAGRPTPLVAGATDAVAGNADAAVFLLIGLLGGAHCLGMCGPLVTMYAGRLDETTPGRNDTLTAFHVRQHTLFNLGRAASYALLGALVALVGGAVFTTADALGVVADPVRGVTGLAVGLVILTTGAYYLVGKSAALHRLTPDAASSLFGRVTGLLHDRVDRLVGTPGIALLGGIHGLLPCPMTYPAYLYAFAVGDPVRAALLLGLLGVGTVPSLFLYGTLLDSLSPARRASLHRVLGVAFVALAYLPLSHGLMLFGVDVPHVHVPIYQPLG
jgi:hypothetical protein